MSSLEQDTKRMKLSSTPELAATGANSSNNTAASEKASAPEENGTTLSPEVAAITETTKAAASSNTSNIAAPDSTKTPAADSSAISSNEVIDVDAPSDSQTDATSVPESANSAANTEKGDVSGLQKGLVIAQGTSFAIFQLLKELKQDKQKEITNIELKDIATVENKTFHQIYFCVGLEKTSETYLNSLREFIESKPKVLQEASKVSLILDFFRCKGWEKSPQPLKTAHDALLDAVEKTCGSKVVQYSSVYKFSSDNAPFLKKEEVSRITSDLSASSRWKNLETLDFSCSVITELAGVVVPDSVKALNLGSGYFLQSMARFKFPKNLQYLNVSSNSLSSIDFQSFPPSLERLDLRENKMYFLDGVDMAVHLKELDVSENRIDSLKYVTFPRGLKTLSLSHNPIECVKGGRFPESLEYLDLSGLPNESMTGIKFPDSLKQLNLSSSMTSTRGLKLPPNITELNLASCGVNSINPLKLPNSIERLFLSDNNIKTLNKVTFPTALREIWLGDNMISTLKNVQFPASLEVLNMSHDPDEEGDKALTTLKDVYFPAGLKALHLDWHQIKSVEAVEFPHALEELSIAGNELRVFRNVKFGPNLRMLDLSSNDELTGLDNVEFPASLLALKLSPSTAANLPATLVERANSGELKLWKSPVYS